MESKNCTGNHIEKEDIPPNFVFVLFLFFIKIVIFNLNVKIMENEPVRVLTPF